MEHEADHGQFDHGLRDLGQLFVLSRQPPPAAKPAKCSLRHPAAREEGEARSPGKALDHDQGQPEQEAGEQGREPVVSAISEHDLEPRVEPLQPTQQVARTIGVLDVGGMNDDAEQQAGGVDRDMPLAALDLLRRIPAARPPLSVVFTLWVSITAALGLGSRPSRSRNITTR